MSTACGGGPMAIQQHPNSMRVPQQRSPYHQQQQYAAMMGRSGAAMQSRMMAAQNPGMYPPNMATPQHGSTQLEQILTAPQPHYPQQPGGGGAGGSGYSMPPMAGNPRDPHSMHTSYSQQPPGYGMQQHPPGPPPQYPTNRLQQNAGYAAMMGRPGMMAPSPSMQQMMGGSGGSFYSNNNSNNNNNTAFSNFSSLPPQEKLSRFAENL